MQSESTHQDECAHRAFYTVIAYDRPNTNEDLSSIMCVLCWTKLEWKHSLYYSSWLFRKQILWKKQAN